MDITSPHLRLLVSRFHPQTTCLPKISLPKMDVAVLGLRVLLACRAPLGRHISSRTHARAHTRKPEQPLSRTAARQPPVLPPLLFLSLLISHTHTHTFSLPGGHMTWLSTTRPANHGVGRARKPCRTGDSPSSSSLCGTATRWVVAGRLGSSTNKVIDGKALPPRSRVTGHGAEALQPCPKAG